MEFDELYSRALSGVAYGGQSVPAYQPPVPCDPDTGRPPASYIVFNEVQARGAAWASNEPRRVERLVQVHVYTLDPEAMRPIMREARLALRAAGVKIMYTGPQLYEDDTGYHHLPLYSRYVENA